MIGRVIAWLATLAGAAIIGFIAGAFGAAFFLSWALSPLPECFGPRPLEKQVTINGTKYERVYD